MTDKTAISTDMTFEQAKELLGLPMSEWSDAAIERAFRQKSRLYHPDNQETADEDKYKQVGIAKDLLLGKIRARYDRRPHVPEPENDTGPPPGTGGGYKYTPPDSKTVTFKEAVAQSGLPSGVEWKFATPMQRSKSGWRGDGSGKSTYAVVAYGRTDSQHVFLGALHYEEYSNFALGGYHHSIWSAKSFEYPIKADDGTNPAWLYGKVVAALKAVGFDGRFNSKVSDAAGWDGTDSHWPHGPEVSIKNWLVNSGQVAGDAPSVANRKQVVELILGRTSLGQPKPGYYPEPPKRSNTWGGEYRGEYYKLTLEINGRPFVLNEADTTKFLGLNRPLDAIFGTYYYDGSKKVLTRMTKGGKKLLAWMAENFKGLPDDAQQALQAASDQMKG